MCVCEYELCGLHGAAAKSSVTGSVHMVQMILIFPHDRCKNSQGKCHFWVLALATSHAAFPRWFQSSYEIILCYHG